jgi:hypothetical protein
MPAVVSTPPIKLTDRKLFSRELEQADKVVLGFTLGVRERDPSRRQLVKWAGLNEKTVRAAQNRLAAIKPIWRDDDDGGVVLDGRGQPVEQPWSLISLDRPSTAAERNINDPRYARSTRAYAVAATAEPGQNPHRWTQLPGAVIDRIPRRGKNRALLLLVAVAYARLQLRHGAIQAPDEVVAWQLGVEKRKVRTARETLAKAGVIVPFKKASPAWVWTMPGGTPGKPENPEALDTRRTPRLHTLQVYGSQYRLFGSENELDEAARLLHSLGEWATTALLPVAPPPLECEPWPCGYGDEDYAGSAAALIDAAKSLLLEAPEIKPFSGDTAGWSGQEGQLKRPILIPRTPVDRSTITASGRDGYAQEQEDQALKVNISGRSGWPLVLEEAAVRCLGERAATRGTLTHSKIDRRWQMAYAWRAETHGYLGPDGTDELMPCQVQLLGEIAADALDFVANLAESRDRHAALDGRLRYALQPRLDTDAAFDALREQADAERDRAGTDNGEELADPDLVASLLDFELPGYFKPEDPGW